MAKSDLDHLIWSALTGEQFRFSIGTSNARRFHADIGPLAAIRDTTADSLADLANLVHETGPLALMQPGEPLAVPGAEIVKSAKGVQMVFSGDADALDLAAASTTDPRIVALDESDFADMLALAQFTQPGPFSTRTGELGQFWGVRQDGRLLAMAGQRLRTDSHAEVSGVCVHPDARGLGLAALLSRRVLTAIRQGGRTPILHSYADNEAALRLYRKLGFILRAPVSLTIYAPKA